MKMLSLLLGIAVVGLSASAADRYALPKAPRTPTYSVPTYRAPSVPAYSVPRTTYKAPTYNFTPPATRATTVSPYLKQSGTYVAPHFRSMPDKSFNNNWTTKPQVNPYTGALGTRTPRSR